MRRINVTFINCIINIYHFIMVFCYTVLCDLISMTEYRLTGVTLELEPKLRK